MKTVLTCGHPYSGYQQAHLVLVAAGLQPARHPNLECPPQPQCPQPPPQSPENQPPLQGSRGQISPSDEWKSQAKDWFGANRDSNCWGWSDSNLVRLLEFWLDFDSQTRFLLVYASPSTAHVQTRTDCHTPADKSEQEQAAWQAYNEELLRFYQINPDRCLLVNAAAVILNPAELVEKANCAFDLQLAPLPLGFKADSTGYPSIGTQIKPQLEHPPKLEAIYQELERSAGLSGKRLTLQAQIPDKILREMTQSTRNLDLPNPESIGQSQMVEQLNTQLKALSAEKDEVAKLADYAISITEEQSLELNALRQEIDKLTLALASKTTEYQEPIQPGQGLHHAACPQNQPVDRGESKGDANQRKHHTEDLQTEITGFQESQTQLQLEKETIQSLLKAQKEAQATQIELKAQLERALNDQQARIQANQQFQTERGLLLRQIREMQDDLERYFLKSENIARLADKTPRTQPGSILSPASLPVEILFDLRRGLDGDNWYEAEYDGRWAGPKTLSTINLPALSGGRYEIQFEVVDAMEPGILLGMEVSLNGQPLSLFDDWVKFPATVRAQFEADMAGDSPLWVLHFKFPKVLSPANQGSSDQRSLAIRMRQIKLTLLG